MRRQRWIMAYAIVREDAYQGPEVATADRVKVLRVLRSEEEAILEVQRLQSLGKSEVNYFWQATKLILEDDVTSE